MACPSRRRFIATSCKRGSAGDFDLQSHQIQSSQAFGDRMLDLQPRVDFEKVKLLIRRQQKFHGAGADIADGLSGPNCREAHFGPQFVIQSRSKGFLRQSFDSAAGSSTRARTGE